MWYLPQYKAFSTIVSIIVNYYNTHMWYKSNNKVNLILGIKEHLPHWIKQRKG